MKRTVGFLAQNGTPRAAQRDALSRRGCATIVSEGTFDREIIGDLTPGDELVVWRLDELGMNATEIISLVAKLSLEGIAFSSVVDNIDLGSPVGEFCVALTMIRKKTHRARVVKGMEAAREAGHPLGRDRKLAPSDIELIEAMISSRDISVAAAARQFGVGRSTLQRYLSEARVLKQKGG